MSKNNVSASTQPKWMTVTSWVLTVPVAGLFAFSALGKFIGGDEMNKMFTGHFGYPAGALLPIGIVELLCVVIWLIPRTSVLGAVLLTGYMGGAIATHVRVSEPFVMQVLIGMVIWLTLFLRMPALRSLLPVRRTSRAWVGESL